MTTKQRWALATLSAAVVSASFAAATLAKPVSFALPAESTTLKKTPASGYTRADILCVICHSRDYITTQPRGLGKDFWLTEVDKMVTVYAAPIPQPDRAVIAEYLASAY